jgi:microcystin-dependent protein
MSEPFVGEIRMFAGNFAPSGWVFCDGQLLAISQNDALFSLIGTIYGGDGETTFGLPDLRGRIPIHTGTGPGLSPKQQGQQGGTETETLTVNQIPSHTHALTASSANADDVAPAGKTLAATTHDLYITAPSAGDMTAMHAAAVTNAGGSQSHSNLMPTLCIHFIISLFGIFPSPN